MTHSFIRLRCRDCDTSRIGFRESRGGEQAKIFASTVREGDRYATPLSCAGLNHWQFLRHGPMSGSVLFLTAIYRPLEEMPEDENNFAIIPVGVKYVIKINMIA